MTLTTDRPYSLELVTTRHPRGHRELRWNGRVTHSVDRKREVAPVSGLRQAGRGHVTEDLVVEVQSVGRTPFYLEAKGVDMIRVPVPVPDNTAPRRGASGCLRSGWPFGGVFVFGHAPIRTSDEGVGMTT